jgi:hypothetical protein
MRTSLVTAAIAAVMGATLAGCMSEAAYRRLDAKVFERNQRRYRSAEAKLQAQGYRFSDAELFLVRFPREPMRQRCVDAFYPASVRPPGYKPIDSSERTIVSAMPSRPSPTVELDVAANDACQFFAGRTDQLEAKNSDGSTTHLIRVRDDVRPARDAKGEIVLVDVSRRVLFRREVLVDLTCDHMPRSDPDPTFELVRVIFAPAPPPHVEMVVGEEQLDVKCTKNTS